VVQTPRRNEFSAIPEQHGVATGIHYPTPLHLQPEYLHLGSCAGSFPIAEGLASRIVSLPLFAAMTDPEIGQLTRAARTFINALVHI
jgi:dTDP-4-amino-4,6-dideoxygalactose transaminase